MRAITRSQDVGGGRVSPRDVGAVVVMASSLPLMLLASLWSDRSFEYKQLLITAFCAVFGMTMLLGGGDAFRHQMRVEAVYASMPFSIFLEDLWRMLMLQLTSSGAREPYIHVLSYFFGAMVGLPYLFFPFVGAVYGYFFGGSLLLFLRHLKLSRANGVLLVAVFFLVFIRGFDGMATVRTWTGMWVLVYACLNYYETRRMGYLLLMFSAPLFHFSFLLMAIPAWIVLVFGSRPTLYATLLGLSTFTNVLQSEPFTGLLSGTEIGAQSVGAYQVDEQRVAVEEFRGLREQTNWYNAYRGAGLQRWAPTILAFTLIAAGIYHRGMSAYQRRIFSIGVLTLAFSNLTWFLFAVHNRTLTIAMVFILGAFLLARLDPATAARFRGLPPYYQWGVNISLLLFLPLILFSVSLFLDRLSVFMLAVPWAVLISPEVNMAMKEFLNTILGRR